MTKKVNKRNYITATGAQRELSPLHSRIGAHSRQRGAAIRAPMQVPLSSVIQSGTSWRTLSHRSGRVGSRHVDVSMVAKISGAHSALSPASKTSRRARKLVPNASKLIWHSGPERRERRCQLSRREVTSRCSYEAAGGCCCRRGLSRGSTCLQSRHLQPSVLDSCLFGRAVGSPGPRAPNFLRCPLSTHGGSARAHSLRAQDG